MPAPSDTARFRADDPDELVLASLACPLCLRTEEVLWEASFDGDYDPSVECTCPHCDERWRVYLMPEQELRLGLMGVRHA
jgi:DNA-directed RNA polymerase subunit M/transcription elongation factor TFIIS